jgi:ElaB/YqjD/DUF883 family membrane-anchored ribosome-binding protein
MRNGGERPEDYEREIARDRAEIGATIDAIQHRLSPGQLLDQALDYVKTSGGEAVGSVMRSAKQNPWPIVLTGIGLAWLMQSTAASRRSEGHSKADEGVYSDRASEGRRQTPPEYDAVPRHDAEYHAHRSLLDRVRAAGAEVTREVDEAEEAFQSRLTEAKARAMELSRGAGETIDAFRERVEAAIGRAQDAIAGFGAQASNAWQRGSEAVGTGAHYAREQIRRTGDRAVQFYEQEPLVAGAIGVVAGTLIGALLPSTEAEDRLLGEHGRRIRRSATDIAASAAERAQAAATEGVLAAAEAAEKAVRSEPADTAR